MNGAEIVRSTMLRDEDWEDELTRALQRKKVERDSR